MSTEPWSDTGPLGLVFAYSEWLDAQGLVVADQTPGADTRTHAELAVQFIAERRCDESCHNAGLDTCPKCDTLRPDLVCDSCRTYLAMEA